MQGKFVCNFLPFFLSQPLENGRECGMPILEKLKRVIKSWININDILDKANDPEKMLDQFIEDMRQELREAKIQVAAAIRDQHSLERQYADNLQQAKIWEERAIKYVQNGNDDYAKLALRRKRSFNELADGFKEQLDAQRESVEVLKNGLTTLEAKIEEARRKKLLLIAKRQRAEAQRAINETMAGISASDAFDRMKNTVDDAEARAAASEEMQKLSLEYQISTLEEEDDIDSELTELKAKISQKEDKTSD